VTLNKKMLQLFVRYILCNDSVCFHLDERETDVTDVAATESLQVAATASLTDEDAPVREPLFLVSLGQMIYHFLALAIDMKGSNLTDELVAKDILSPPENQEINDLKQTDAKVNNMLLMMMGKKSAAQFESFLTTLSETGQQSVADIVRQALRRTEHNPLEYAYGMPA